MWVTGNPSEGGPYHPLLHGLRVSGYNSARRVNRELAVAQGAWDSDAHERYDRFTLSEVVSLPANMISIATGGDDTRFAAPSVVPPAPPVLTVGPNAPLALPPPRTVVDLPAPRSRIRVFGPKKTLGSMQWSRRMPLETRVCARHAWSTTPRRSGLHDVRTLAGMI